MPRSPGLMRGRGRALGLVVLAGVLVVVAGSLARASGAGGITAVSKPSVAVGYPQAEADQPWAYQRFLVSGQADMSRLNQMGVDLGESLDKNDGRDDVGVRRRHRRAARLPRQARLPAGLDRADLRRRRESAGRDDASGCAWSTPRSAPRRSARGVATKRPFAATETIKITRADYYQSLSGTWLSVEAKSSAAQGNAERARREAPAARPPAATGAASTAARTTGACWGNPAGGASALSTAACPALAVTYSTDGGATYVPGFQTNMQPDLDDGRLPLPLPARQAGPQGQRRDRAAPADPGPGRVELRQRPDSAGDDVHRHAAAVPGRVPARLLHAATRRPRTARR